MAKISVTETVPGSDLEKVDLDSATLSLTIKKHGHAEESFNLRVMSLPDVNGKSFLDWVFDWLADLLDQTEGDEHEFYRWVMLMVAFHNICPKLDRQRKRKFNLKTFDKSEALLELAETTRMKGRSRSDRLIKFAGETPTATTRLLQEAIYVRPDLEIPLSEKHYLQFRDQIFSEIRWVSGEVDQLAKKAIEEARQKTESNSEGPSEKRAATLAKLRAMEDEGTSGLLPAWQQAMQFLIQKALEMEDEESKRFSDQGN